MDQIPDLRFYMVLIIILLFIIGILFLVNFFSNLKYKNFPPGPKPLPILGNMHMLEMRKPHKIFYQLSNEFGPIFSFRMGMTKVVILCGYNTIYDALINNADAFSNRPQNPLFTHTIKDNGIVFANGTSWKLMRKFTLSTLRNYSAGKKSIENKIIEEAEWLVKSLKSYRGTPISNFNSIDAAVTNIIVAMLLGKRFNYTDPILLRLMSLVNENNRMQESLLFRLYSMFPFLLGCLFGFPRTFTEKFMELQSFISAIFNKSQMELEANDQSNLIDAFLLKQQEDTVESMLYYRHANFNVLVGDLFGAGIETMSTTLRWSLLLMIKYPEVQKKVQNEIEKVIGLDQPEMEHRKQMPYTDAVIHEIQRFGDVTPITVPHVTSQDVTFRGYFIPRGTPVIPVLHSIHKDNEYFEKPEEFYPEHFLDLEGNFKMNEAFIPFSIGRRSCVGETVARMEIFLFFTTLLQHFIFKAPAGAKLDLTPEWGSINAPKPFKIYAIPRS